MAIDSRESTILLRHDRDYTGEIETPHCRERTAAILIFISHILRLNFAEKSCNNSRSSKPILYKVAFKMVSRRAFGGSMFPRFWTNESFLEFVWQIRRKPFEICGERSYRRRRLVDSVGVVGPMTM